MSTVPPAAFTPRAFCEAYGIGKTTLYQLLGNGDLIARKIGGRKTVILREDAERWANSLPVATLERVRP